MKLVEDNEKRSWEEQKNTKDEEINGLLLVHNSYQSCEKNLKDESVFVQTGEKVNLLPEFNNFGFCDQDFSDESNHTTRICEHSGEKRYTCNLCEYVYL